MMDICEISLSNATSSKLAGPVVSEVPDATLGYLRRRIVRWITTLNLNASGMKEHRLEVVLEGGRTYQDISPP